jgi:transcriptional regulator with XRE-family HTH domain
MDFVRIGLSIRALRRRRGWTQAELGRRARCSAALISRVERGLATRIRADQLDRIVGALGARLRAHVLWEGEELDRLLDRSHAGIVEAVATSLTAGWIVIPEATFQVRGERGSIDILAWHPIARALMVVEVKSVVPDVQATLAGIDRKARLAPVLAHDRGWDPAFIGRILVLPDDRTARRRVHAFAATFHLALPARTREVRRWLAKPAGSMAGILFLSDLPPVQARQRVRSVARPTTHGRAPRS